jgi:hypothetical protein
VVSVPVACWTRCSFESVSQWVVKRSGMCNYDKLKSQCVSTPKPKAFLKLPAAHEYLRCVLRKAWEKAPDASAHEYERPGNPCICAPSYAVTLAPHAMYIYYICVKV